MSNKYDKEAQQWASSAKEKRADSFVTVLAFFCAIFGYYLLNGIADWCVGL